MGSGSTAGTKGVPRAEREQQILDAATEEFGRRGFAGASIALIAEQAQISKPLIYGYFGSKEGLYVACVERAGAELSAAIEEVLTGTEPTMRMAEETLRAIFTVLQHQPHAWTTVYDRSLPEGSAAEAASRRVLEQIFSQGARGVGMVLTAQGMTDPLDLSAVTEIWASAVTALVNWWVRHPEQSAEQMIQRSVRILGGLAPNRRSPNISGAT